MPSKHTYPELLRANQFLRKASDQFYFLCTTRTVQESKLFPVNPYIALSYFQAWYTWPTLLRKIDAAMPAEEIGDRARNVGSYVSTITLGLIPQFYLGARQFLMDMGMLKPTDAIDDVMFVLDFGQRINLSYHRSSGYILNSDANNRAQIHTERQTQVFEADALPCKPGDHLHTAYNRFMATVSAYGFLSHCECRLSFHNHGPYKLDDGEMLVRDLIDLAECDYPWMDGVAAKVPHNNLTVPVLMKDTHFHMVDDWGSFEASPSFEGENVRGVGLYESDYLSDGYIPVHMESATELAEYFDHLNETMQEATANMWRMMAGWSREQMIDAGLLVYSGVLKDLAHFAGVYEQDDWFVIEDRVQRFKPLMNDEYGGMAIAELVGLVSLQTQQTSEYHMAKYNDSRGDLWTGIPYSILEDDEWTSTVGEPRGGSSSLPGKTAGYQTTRGKLTQDEANAAAREHRPSTWKLRHYDDEPFVKFHPEDPRAKELYEATQQGSKIEGRGAALLRSDL